MEINLEENAVYIIQDGNKTKITPKDYGEDCLIWKNGKVLDVVRNERKRVKGQEVI